MSLCTLSDSLHVQAGQKVIHPPLDGITERFKLNAWDKHTSVLLLLSDHMTTQQHVAKFVYGDMFLLLKIETTLLISL